MPALTGRGRRRLTACMLKMVVWEMIIGQYRVCRSSWALALSKGTFPQCPAAGASGKGVSRFSRISSPKSCRKQTTRSP